MRDIFKDKELNLYSASKKTPISHKKPFDIGKQIFSLEPNSSKHDSCKKNVRGEFGKKRNINTIFSNLNISESHKNFFNLLGSSKQHQKEQKQDLFFSSIKMSEFVDIGKVTGNQQYKNADMKKVIHVPSLKMFSVEVVL